MLSSMLIPSWSISRIVSCLSKTSRPWAILTKNVMFNGGVCVGGGKSTIYIEIYCCSVFFIIIIVIIIIFNGGNPPVTNPHHYHYCQNPTMVGFWLVGICRLAIIIIFIMDFRQIPTHPYHQVIRTYTVACFNLQWQPLRLAFPSQQGGEGDVLFQC